VKGTGARGDAGFDRLVERELGRGAGTPGPCPQVELLAAWFDGSLPPPGVTRTTHAEAGSEQSAGIEAHLAECGHCREVVAGLARTEPEVLYVHPQRERAPWTWHLRWVAPAAAAVLVLLAVGTQVLRAPGRIEALPERQASQRAAPFVPADTAAPSAAPPLSPQPAPPEQKLALRAEPALPGKAESERAGESRARTKAPIGGEIPDRPAPDRLADARTVPPAALDKADKGAVTSRPQATMAEAGAAGAETAPRPVAAPTAQGETTGSLRVTPVAAGIAGPVAFAPGDRVGWRYVRPGQVYRSDDGGTTWSQQALPHPARLSLLSAVSPSVCWGAGPGGALVRTVDGATWHVVTPPVQADFVSLVAHSAARASVSTADGVTYDTSDAGATWRQR